MRVVMLLAWLLLPVLAIAYHLGPGQHRKQLDSVARVLADVQRHVDARQWEQVVELCDRALAQLPKERVADGRRLVLERAKARMLAEQLPVAREELQALVDEMREDATADPKLLAEVQSALASAHYYVTWLARLEGLPRESWESEIEASRQLYRMLADQAEQAGDQQATTKNRENLESSIRLARMDLKELQALALPSQCKGCKSCCNNPKRGGKGQPKQGEKPPEDARAASSGPPPDNRGS